MLGFTYPPTSTPTPNVLIVDMLRVYKFKFSRWVSHIATSISTSMTNAGKFVDQLSIQFGLITLWGERGNAGGARLSAELSGMPS